MIDPSERIELSSRDHRHEVLAWYDVERQSFAFVVKDRETDLQCMRLRLTIWTMNPKDPETIALKTQADDLARAAVIEQRPRDGGRIDGLIQLLLATEPWAFPLSLKEEAARLALAQVIGERKQAAGETRMKV